ncbi:MAG: hypothetical protein HYV15_08070 [Elusimicrobia bacterium]|nr:hypothetical protein [Elusimicrobiota bacterium]
MDLPDWARRLAKDPAALSAVQELVPGKLQAAVFSHTLPVGPDRPACLTYISHGLAAHRQREIVLTVLCPEGASAPKAPLELFRLLLPLAEQGRTVEAGGFTQFLPGEFMGFTGLTYVDARGTDAYAVPAAALAAVALHAAELEVAKSQGGLRMAAQLGLQARVFPCPLWLDRARPALPVDALLRESVLGGLPRARVSGATATLEDGRVVLRVLRGSAALLRQMLERTPEATVALLLGCDPRADGCFVWEPGSDPRAITPPGGAGKRLAGCFLAVGGNPGGDAVSVFEDGFAAALGERQLGALKAAAADGGNFAFTPEGGGLGFALQWVQESFQNPVDGKTYSAKGGWATVLPERPAGRAPDPVAELERIVLLTGPEEAEGALSSGELAAYAKDLEVAVRMHFKRQAPGPGAELVVQLELAPGAAPAIRARGDALAERLPGLCELAAVVPAPPAQGPLAFQLEFTVWGGAAPRH